LRERPEDIPQLAECFVQKHRITLQRPGIRLTPEALELLQHYDWPGNVRELENVIERAMIFSNAALIQPEDLVFPTLRDTPSTADASHYQMRLEAVEQEVLCAALQAHDGDKRAAARALGLGLSTLYAKLKKYRL
jgi:DNA-binding NtrC family response regulator